MIRDRLGGLWRRRSRVLHLGLIVALLCGLIAAYLTTSDYGESWDEATDRAYGFASRRAYKGDREFLSYGNQVYHGPFYLMMWTSLSSRLKTIHPGWTGVDAGHFANFLTFLIGTVAFYVICHRLVKMPSALAATLLHATQPMFYGHAYVNQKDTPFIAFLMVAIAMGVVAVDVFDKDTRRVVPPTFPEAHANWRHDVAADLRRLRGLAAAHPWKASAGLVILSLAVSLLVGYPAKTLLQAVIRDAYAGKALPLVDRWFVQIAENAGSIPVDSYVMKATAIYDRWRIMLGLAVGISLPILAKAGFPASLAKLDSKWLRRTCLIVASGAVMGLACSIRVAGPLAGAVVSAYFVSRAGKRAVVPLLGYWAAGFLATYTTWPFLWGSPIARLAESFSAMADFSGHDHILFRGAYVSSSSLPWDYVATLMPLELTIPALVLFLWGVVTLSVRLSRGRIGWGLASVPVMWLGGPFLAFVILRTPIYDNLRQVMFALPPVFLVGAFALEELWRLLRGPFLQAVAVALLLLPGIAGIVTLHPYEYIYFNQLTGGVAGANAVFGLDFWCTSYREAISYVNSVAPGGAPRLLYSPEPSELWCYEHGCRVAMNADGARYPMLECLRS